MIGALLISLALSSASGNDGVANEPDKNFRGRYVAVKTNVAPWAMGVVNVEGEIQVGSRLSVDLPVWWSPYFISDKFALRTFLVQPECRYWLKTPGRGHFLGVHAGVAWFNLRLDDSRYQDVDTPLLNGGISYGYSLRLNNHLDTEFTIGAGYVNTKYDRYYNIHNGALIDTRRTSYFGIDRIGISIVYHFDI